MAAGASILNPAVPAILITPINNHSLSCRPLVLPFSTRLEVSIAPDARCQCVHLSNDGRLQHHHIIRKGDRVIFTASHYPVPCFGSENQVSKPIFPTCFISTLKCLCSLSVSLLQPHTRLLPIGTNNGLPRE